MYNINRHIFKTLSVIFLAIAINPLFARQVPDSSSVRGRNAPGRPMPEKKGVPLRGTVKDAASGKPLAGINVSVSDYSAVLSDDKGRFSLRVPDYQAVLEVSGQGFQAKEIPLKGRKELSVSLYEEGFVSVYEKAETPVGTRALNNISYPLTSINLSGSWSANSETAGSYLQGVVPGLHSVRRSGTPGIGAELYLRGFTSLYATNEPLIVVDGMIYDNKSYGNSLVGGHVNNPLQYIDIRDIDNISVIKGTGAAVYGTRAANGVVLITTSRAQELATRIDFAAYGGVNLPVSSRPVMNASDYRVYLSDMLKSSGLSDASIAAMPYMNDNASANQAYYNYHSDQNWQKKVFKESYDNDYYLKITGGDNIATYGLSMGYMKDRGIIDQTNQVKYNTRFNADFNLAKKLTARANLSFTYNEQQLKDEGLSVKTNPMYVALVKAPFLTTNVYDADGNRSPAMSDTDIFGISNPSAIISNVQDEMKGYRFFGAVNFDYTFNPLWKIGTLIGVTYDKTRERTFIPRAGVANDTLSNAVADSRMSSQVMRLFSLYNDTRVSFSKAFDKHKLNVTAGVRFNQDDSEQDYALAYNSATDQLVSIGNGDASLRNLGGEIGKWRWLNNYLSAEYSFAGKYFAGASLAMDGSSRFGTEAEEGIKINGVKMALMPAFNAAWLLSSENFMAGMNAVNLLKIRAGYSVTGNDDIGNYTARQYYVSQNLLGMEGLVRGNIANKALQWETVKKINAGIDAAVLNERISFSIDWYRNQTSKMLTYEPTTTVSGIDFYVSNSGQMETHGIELSLNGRIVNKPNLKWDAGISIGSYKNKVTSLPYASLESSYAGATYITRSGQAANLFYGYRTDGVYTSDAEAASAGYSVRTASGELAAFKGGDRRFIDMNGDKIIDESDRTVIGDPNPDLFGGFSTKLSWKKWTFDALMTFSYGNDLYNYVRADLESESNYNNQTMRINNRWRANGQVTDVPKATYGDPMDNSRFSDQWIEDGSWLRLRTVSLSYELPFKTQSLKYTRVYFTGSNLLTFTKYLGYDPEFSAGGSVFMMGADTNLQPQFRSFQLGVRIGL